MCGIIGQWQVGDAPVGAEGRIAAGFERLAHRGPDGRGVVVESRERGALTLGHTRLSIIDLTDGGRQPMASSDGRHLIAFNGELYNYRELRDELRADGCTFQSESDTEVLLSAWSRWGAAGLPRLIGMFVFVVYDRVAGTLTIVRDAFGIKPLFYSADDDCFSFASELPALVALRGISPRLNRQRAHDYLVHAIQDAGDESFVDGISVLPPSHVLELALRPAAQPSVTRWWRPSIGESALSFDAAVEAVRDTFLQSVRLHLRSDVPVGAALSGGIDSSALTCAMRWLEPDMPIHTFSFIADHGGLSEEPWVDIVNAHVGARVHKVRIDRGDLARDLPDLIRAQGEPFCTTSMYAQYRVFQAARDQGVTVVLEGQGADELLGGYEGYPGPRAWSLFERGQWRALASFARQWREWPGRESRSVWRALAGQLLPDAAYRAALGRAGVQTAPSWLDLDALIAEGVSTRPVRVPRAASARGRRLVETLAHALTETYLPSLLRYGDRNAMRFSVENRVPFLSTQMADLLLSLPEAYLVSTNGETKSVFRAAMRGIVPSRILDRRDKVGFETPMRQWLQGSAPHIREVLAATSQFPFLSPSKMVAAFDASQAGRSTHDAATWRMINLCLWSKEFGVH